MIKDFRPELIPYIRDLTLRGSRDVLSRTLTGKWLSNMKGRGIEFSGYRTYQATDDSARIDWRASLRARKLLIKEFTQERNLNVVLLVDVSESMCYGSGSRLKAEEAAGMASSIAWAALRSNDSVSLVMYADEIRAYLEPAVGMAQHHAITTMLAKNDKYGGKQDLPRVLHQLMGLLKQRALIVIISDFLSLEENWAAHLRIAARKYEMIGIGIRDPRDRRMPRAGQYALEDPATGEKIIVDAAAYATPYAEYVQQEEAQITKTFRLINGDFIVVETGHEYLKPLMRFFAGYAERVVG